jgi:carboxypeptidase C (cathepsin A)
MADEKKTENDAKDGKDAKDDTADRGVRADPPEITSVTKHEIALGGRRIAYTATTGTILLRGGPKHEARASMFYVAYTEDGARPEARPVTFCFNGGPGSSSVWLHLGAFGPKRAAFPDPKHAPPPPYALEDNDASLLDLTDLVFVDPVGTGFSRSVGDVKPEEFFGPTPDVESVSEFVRAWVTRNQRWNSAKVLAGESYGGTRVAAMAPYLQDRGMFLNGIVLVSPALDLQALEFGPDNDLPSVLYLPSYAITAHYHGALRDVPVDLDAWLREIREFAIREYAPALILGARVPAAERARIVEKLAHYTGLPAAWIARNDMRIDIMRFVKELLRDRDVVVGRLDSRFVGHDDDRGTHVQARDPSFVAPHGPYAALMNDYVRRALGMDEERAYEIISMKVNESWKWEVPKGKSGGYLNVVGPLRGAMLENPHLRVFFANGLYDLATPFFAAEHAASHLGTEPHVRANVTEAYYEAGHMMYLHPASRTKLKVDLARFYASAAPNALDPRTA